MREVVEEMAAQYYASVTGASNHINNNIINMKVSCTQEEPKTWRRVHLITSFSLNKRGHFIMIDSNQDTEPGYSLLGYPAAGGYEVTGNKTWISRIKNVITVHFCTR